MEEESFSGKRTRSSVAGFGAAGSGAEVRLTSPGSGPENRGTENGAGASKRKRPPPDPFATHVGFREEAAGWGVLGRAHFLRRNHREPHHETMGCDSGVYSVGYDGRAARCGGAAP